MSAAKNTLAEYSSDTPVKSEMPVSVQLTCDHGLTQDGECFLCGKKITTSPESK